MYRWSQSRATHLALILGLATAAPLTAQVVWDGGAGTGAWGTTTKWTLTMGGSTDTVVSGEVSDGPSSTSNLIKTGINEITVPEPGSYGAILMGFGLAAWALRRPRRKAVA
jgi:hypothetical protein